jgi:hypothetical protein
MTLAIRKLATVCRASSKRREAARVVDRVARERLASELDAHLGSSLAAQPDVVRIRRLQVRVVIPPGPLNENAIASAWAGAFGRALFQALAYPDGQGRTEVIRAATWNEFIAALLRDIADGVAAGRWQYAEFADFLRLPPPEAMLAILRAEPPDDRLRIFLELEKAGVLDRVLARWDELNLARLFQDFAADGAGSSQDEPGHAVFRTATFAAVTLEAVAQLIGQHGLPRGWKLNGRRQGLRLFVLSRRNGGTRSPGAIAWALGLIAGLLENPWIARAEVDTTLAGSSPIVEELCRLFPMGLRPDVASLLDQIRPLVPTAAPPGSMPMKWIESDCAALLLLIRLVMASSSKLQPPPFFLVGLALTVLGRFDPDLKVLDPAIDAFAGFEELPPMDSLREFLRAPARPEELENAAAELIRAFTDRLPGLRKSSRDAIVRQILVQPGRLRWEERRLLVVLDPSPYHVALRISGADDPVDAVPWLAGRRLEFLLEGL